MALVANDVPAFVAALSESEGACDAVRVGLPRLGGQGMHYLPTDVPPYYSGAATDHAYYSTAECAGLFMTADCTTIWGASAFQGDRHYAFGEEMLVGYSIDKKALAYEEGDSIFDIARRNNRPQLADNRAPVQVKAGVKVKVEVEDEVKVKVEGR